MSKSVKRALGVLLLLGTLIAPVTLLHSVSADAEAAVIVPVKQATYVNNGVECSGACSDTPCCFIEE